MKRYNLVSFFVLLTVLLLSPYAICEQYDFYGNSLNTVTLTGYLDGAAISVLGEVGNDQSMKGMRWISSGSWFGMDVDTTDMTTSLEEMHSIQLSSAIGTGVLDEGGFGGMSVPFTITMENSFMDMTQELGPYSIDQQLEFEMYETSFPSASDVIHFDGSVEINGQQQLFSYTHNINYSHMNVSGTFDDSGYPETLSLDLSSSGFSFFCASTTDVKLAKAMIDGHLFELYANTSYIDFGWYGNWEGQQVPEPCSLLLLGCGGLVLRRRKRKG